MKHIYLRSRSLQRLLSFGSKNKFAEEPSTKDRINIKSSDEASLCMEVSQKPTWRCFSYEEIHRATNGFHRDNLVGRGGYSEVYRGVIGENQGQTIAVKRLTRALTEEQKEKDFLMELGMVGHVSHPNVCAFLGCCIDRELYLVFEFSSRGSVSSNLHDEKSPPLEWKVRYNIAIGTARGLEYLHKGCQRRIIHRDIKASNILLTANYEPKISDFGLAKWLPTEWSHRAVAPIEGTFGCLAPEYFTHGIVDEKTDIFAFGVFLLEIITGRKPVDGSHKSLLSWAKPFLKDGNIDALIDPRINYNDDQEKIKKLVFVASLCIRASAAWRPSMTEVLELLEGVEIQQDQWKMPEEEAEEDEFWDFDDLDDDDDDDDNEPDTPSSQSSALSA
ncbi:Protein kinase family protein [Rhynchospora pubera]|uniref:Protein kinase family protein n=1 Tax=Rhynchospora pubera TaxID=906938 RepID=A0AAV8HE58_9POAL|nr:Protein kinase family protein [Rhynchospora pubera]